VADVKTAKLFRNGGSQAVRLPAEFRFDGEIVYIWQGERAGEVVLSPRAPGGTLARFLERAGELDEDFEFDIGRAEPEHPDDRRNLFEGVGDESD